MQTIINALLAAHIIIPSAITIILCLTCYLIGVLQKTTEERKIIQEIVDFAERRDERISSYFNVYNTRAYLYAKKHKLYYSFIIFLERTHFNMNIDPEQTDKDIETFNRKLEEVKEMAHAELSCKIAECITLDHNYCINTTQLKIAMQKELSLT